MKPVEILLVEDNPADVLLAKHAFEKSKIINNLHVAEDGEKAINFLFKKDGYEDVPTPDLIMLDLNLPKIDGHTILERIKNTEKLRRIPIVIMSGSHAQSDIAKSYDLHANCYIVKPVNLSKLSEVTKTLDNFWFSMVTLPPKD